MNHSIESELTKCRQSAMEGYKLAGDKYNEIKNILIEEANRLSQADAEQNRVKRIQNTKLVETQKKDLEHLTNSIKSIRDDLKSLYSRAQDFSIVVYGRTMAGKSTLMEILTHGNGDSIGNGAQRTTRDVRHYYWNGLKITDVPGICAFDGAEDERKALEAAKAADLILFLLTSNAPQPDEAACFAKLKSFGKPILGVVNVRKKFNINDDLDIEDLQDELANTSDIDAIVDQFKKFSVIHNQDWIGIKFVATHLLSAYQSQGKNPKVFKISRFNEVEEFILDKVRKDGRFLRIKNFVDSVSVPMSNIIQKIYEHSGETLQGSDVWLDKRRQLNEWRPKFVERAHNRIDSLYNQLSEQLDAAIYDFSENHYEDEKAGENWQRRFQSLEFDKKYQGLLKQLANECERKRKELSDELTQELSYTFNGNTRTNIELESTTPWGKYAALVLPNLLLFVPGIGWGARIAIGVGSALFSFLFDDKEKKIREAKAKLREDLTAPSHEMLDKMHYQVMDIFIKEILDKGVNEFYNLLADYQSMLARLGANQNKIANVLFDKFSDLNVKLLKEAIDYTSAGSISNIESIPRIPGEIFLIIAQRFNLDTNKISSLLDEKILTMSSIENISDNLQMILGSEFDVKYYPLDFTKNNQKPEKAKAILPKKKVNPKSVKIAQQIADVPIIQR